MNCSPYELKDYILGELAEEKRRRVEEHVNQCRDCREELDRLNLTQAALLSLREEEIPRRIAFVSDKVFEPKWWQRLWASGPRLGFASAIMLSAAILFHGVLIRPVAQAPVGPDPQVIAAEVQQAVAASEERQAKKTAQLLNAAEQKMEFQHRADQVTFEENLKYLQKQMNVRFLASAEIGGAR